MRYRQLPRTDLVLSEVGFGVWTLATNRWGRIPEDQKGSLLENAVESGVTFFDTADSCGEGYCEELLANVLGHRRKELIFSTKFGYDFYDKTTPRDADQDPPQKFDRDFVIFACEQSLRRLRTDYIDLYQVHNPRIDVLERDELFEALDHLQFEGKIRYYGVALGPGIGWLEEGEASMRERHVASVQMIYSILEQEPARGFFPIAQDEQVGLISRAPHASEVLTGRYIGPPTFDEHFNRERDDRAACRAARMKQAVERVRKVRFLAAEELGRSMGQAAIQFCLAQPTIVSVLPDFTNLDELREYTSALDALSLTEQELSSLDDLWRNGFDLEEPVPRFREI